MAVSVLRAGQPFTVVDGASLGTCGIQTALPNTTLFCFANPFTDYGLPPGTYLPEELLYGDCGDGRFCFMSDSPGTDTAAFWAAGFAAVGSPASGTGQTVEFGQPFNLTPSDGLLVGGAIVSVWAMAFAFRALVRVLNSDGYGVSDD